MWSCRTPVLDTDKTQLVLFLSIFFMFFSLAPGYVDVVLITFVTCVTYTALSALAAGLLLFQVARVHGSSLVINRLYRLMFLYRLPMFCSAAATASSRSVWCSTRFSWNTIARAISWRW